MNCKPGDLAVIVRSFVGQEGRIVRVLRMVGRITYFSGMTFDDCWEVEGNLRRREWYRARGMDWDGAIPDLHLRPIRDPGDDATDETLTWLPPVPVGTKEPA